MEGIERAVFGKATADEVTMWLDQHVRHRLSHGVQSVLFRAGRLAAVYGLQLSNGSAIVVKIYRGHVHASADLERLMAVAACQRVLAEAGYPCPVPLDGPVAVDGRLVLLESLLDVGERRDAHATATRRAMAQALAEQVRVLRSVPELLVSSLHKPPAWAAYQHGPWPTPHDPLFGFTQTPAGCEWFDHVAGQAAAALAPQRPPDAIGHRDWVCQNLRFTHNGQEAVSAAYDWDSLLAESEPVLAGVVAGAYTEGSLAGDTAPGPHEVAAFLADYESHRCAPFSTQDQAAAAAAATWVLAYNARCILSAMEHGLLVREGSPLDVLARYGGDAYFRLRW